MGIHFTHFQNITAEDKRRQSCQTIKMTISRVGQHQKEDSDERHDTNNYFSME